MILWRFGPKRLSPSLVVWQVRHALLNVSCPDSVSAPLPAGSWGTAGEPRSTRNVVQTNPEIAVRGIGAPAIERASPQRGPSSGLAAATYHTVAPERRCASQQELRADVADGGHEQPKGDLRVKSVRLTMTKPLAR